MTQAYQIFSFQSCKKLSLDETPPTTLDFLNCIMFRTILLLSQLSQQDSNYCQFVSLPILRNFLRKNISVPSIHSLQATASVFSQRFQNRSENFKSTFTCFRLFISFIFLSTIRLFRNFGILIAIYQHFVSISSLVFIFYSQVCTV